MYHCRVPRAAPRGLDARLRGVLASSRVPLPRERRDSGVRVRTVRRIKQRAMIFEDSQVSKLVEKHTSKALVSCSGNSLSSVEYI